MGSSMERKCVCICVLSSLVAMVTISWSIHHYNTGSWIGVLLTGLIALTTSIVSLVTWDIHSMHPADSHTFISIVTQYLFIRVFVIFMGKRALLSANKEYNNLQKNQENLLEEIISTNEKTEYGKKYGFQNIENYRQFKDSVPLQNYENYKEDIQNIRTLGTQNLLTRDPVVFLARTSGTTGEYKCIPITTRMRSKDSFVAGPLMYYSHHRKVGLDLNRIFTIIYKPRVINTPSGLEMAPVSYHMYKRLPFPVVPEVVRKIDDEQVALYVHAVFGLRERQVGTIELLMAPLMYSFWRMLETKWRQVCGDIEDGQLYLELNLDPILRLEIDKLLVADPERARDLRECFSQGFHGVARRIWPNVRGIRMLTTGGFAHYGKVMEESYMQGIPQLSLAHAGSEAIMGLNLEREHRSQIYTLMSKFAFFEFIPEAACNQGQPETLLAHQLQVGGVYELVLTTRMGLYRYRMGDLIRVVKRNGQCPVYEFLYRLGQILNLFWEKTPENVFYSSVEKTVRDLGLTLTDYTAVEDVHLIDVEGYTNNNGTKNYVLFVELGNNAPMYQLTNQEKSQFDLNLCAEFEFYASLREQRSIAEMKVIQVKPGTFEALKKRIIESTQNQQFKMPRVMRNVHHLKYLLENAGES